MSMTRTNRAKLSFALDTSAGLPHEFRVFSAGWNDTTKGRFLFDDAAARSVMADYAKHGADMMIDLEHLSLESPQESRNFDPDARGWARLGVRGGELWAEDVRWTSDGAERLSQKRQRYVSPAFDVDVETKRVLRLVNIAITSLPATHGLTPLVAAADRGDSMTLEEMMKVAEALDLAPDATLDDFLAKIGALKAPPAEAEEPPPAEEMKADEPKPEDEEQKAMAAQLTRLTGRAALVDALVEVEVWRKSHVELAAREQKLAQERAALEAGKRRALVAEMVKCGAETPATAWEGDADGAPDGKTPAEPWASMAIDKLEARVEKLRAAGAKPHALKAGTAGGVTAVKVGGETVQLSERELRICKETGVSPEDYAANKAAQGRKGAA